MNPDLSKYRNRRICVAVSGGNDSMALLHYLYTHKEEYGITLSALNCDHNIRGEASVRDSLFVKNKCAEYKIPLCSFIWEGEKFKNEAEARAWRRKCYSTALLPAIKWEGADVIATAHHANDNAETVLFNIARGSALSGATGICDDQNNRIIHPLLNCTRAEIEAYIQCNCIEYVEDESNFTDDYTRNKIRLYILPELEKAVPGAVRNICRFAGLAADDEEYFEGIINERGLLKQTAGGYELAFCAERVLFKRAAVKALELLGKRDYTSDQAERLFNLQFCENGKRFEFLKLTAYKEEGKIVICESAQTVDGECAFCAYFRSNDSFSGSFLYLTDQENYKNDLGKFNCEKRLKVLKFDLDAIPGSAVIRFLRAGDKFKKFGGGTKNAGDYFTDKKIPVRVRGQIPLVADGNEVLIAGGVEISDKVKITDKTKRVGYAICVNYALI